VGPCCSPRLAVSLSACFGFGRLLSGNATLSLLQGAALLLPPPPLLLLAHCLRLSAACLPAADCLPVMQPHHLKLFFSNKYVYAQIVRMADGHVVAAARCAAAATWLLSLGGAAWTKKLEPVWHAARQEGNAQARLDRVSLLP